ncbi:MAG: DUF6377 domain-containing protein [Bacteroidales bacterium]|nr:DUF6377 domain-containing protein [Bacteroidales bacterium]
MYFPRIKLLFTLLLVLSCSGEEDRQLLEILDKTLENKPLYEGYFNDKVNVLKEVLNEQTDPEQVFNLDMRLADAYRANCKDSVLVYLTQAREAAGKAGRPDLAAIVDFRTAVTYVKAGYAVEANDILEHYRNADIPDIALRSYYEAEHTYWGETMAYTSTPESYDNKLKNRDLYREKLFGLTEEGSWHWHNLKREVFHEVSDMENTRKHARAMLDVSSENSREYAEAAYYYAYTFNEPEEKEEWLIRSAIADIMCGTRDYSSLNDLSGLMFRNGDIERAFRYAADHCMVDALYFNGKLRPWQITRLFPEIESAYQEKHQRQNRITLTLLLCLAVLFSIMLVLVGFLYRRQHIIEAVRGKLQDSYMEIDNRNRELEEINSRLVKLNARIQESDKVKQEYIGLFLGMVSDNISTFRKYRMRVLKYIRQGNTKAITDEIEQQEPIDNDILEFYKMFDQAFISIYPDFVEKFNNLLADGAEIVPKGDDILTPELRIFALIKLGITDSSRIASLLHYSANTIYNYRAKTKNRARGSRDSFEDAVRNIE